MKCPSSCHIDCMHATEWLVMECPNILRWIWHDFGTCLWGALYFSHGWLQDIHFVNFNKDWLPWESWLCLGNHDKCWLGYCVLHWELWSMHRELWQCLGHCDMHWELWIGLEQCMCFKVDMVSTQDSGGFQPRIDDRTPFDDGILGFEVSIMILWWYFIG